MAREMKDSGLKWMAVVPKGWNQSKIKYVAQMNPFCDYSGLSSDDEIGYMPMECLRNDYIEPKTAKFGTLTTSLSPFSTGDIVMAKVTPCFENGNIAIATDMPNGVGLGTSEIFTIRAKNIDTRFLFYWLQNKDFIEAACSSMTGTGGLKRVSPSFVNNATIFMPKKDEQQLIASFLDSKCAEIDKAVEATKASIEEYKKLRQAIITEAVTKGLDPGVEMKDSGIEWLGYVPKAWSVRQLKSCANVLRGGSPRPIGEYLTDDIDGLNWIKIGDTEKGKRYINSVRQKIKKSGLSKTRQVHRGDLLLTNSMSFGEPYILNVDGCIHDGWLVFTDIKEIDKEYLYYFLLSSTCKDQFSITADGGVVQNLNIEKVQSSIILLPVISEQHKIVDYLNSKCSEIDSLIKSKEKLIEELTAYRKSLIFEYVTGKKEVPAV